LGPEADPLDRGVPIVFEECVDAAPLGAAVAGRRGSVRRRLVLAVQRLLM
jgi:hypothetical protein